MRANHTNQIHHRNQQTQAQIAKLLLKERFPASVQMALIHQQANRFGQSSNTKTEVCPCCDERVKNQPYSICLSTNDKSILGSVALYFQFVRIAIGYIVLRLVICDGYNLITNHQGTDCGNPQVPLMDQCIPDKYTLGSVANKSTNTRQLQTVDTLNLILTVASILYFLLCRWLQCKQYVNHDVSISSQQDFSIFVTGVPLWMGSPCAYETELKRVFEGIVNEWLKEGVQGEHGVNRSQLWREYLEASNREENIVIYNQKTKEELKQSLLGERVTSIDLCWDLDQITIIRDIREDIKDAIQQEASSKYSPGTSLQDSNDYINDLGRDLMQVSKTYVKICERYAGELRQSKLFCLSNFVGKAFVSFQYEHFAKAVLEYAKHKKIMLYGQELNITKATSPRDIYWQNLSFHSKRRMFRWLRSLFITLCVLLVVFLFAVGMEFFLDTYIASHQTSSQGTQSAESQISQRQAKKEQVFLTFAVIGVSVFTYLVNYYLESAMYELTLYEKHETRTHFELSFMYKLLVSQFINTVVVFQILSRIGPFVIWGPSGLIPQMGSFLMVSSIIDTVLSIVRVGRIQQRIYYCRKYKGRTEVPIHQDRLNLELQYPMFDMTSQYTYYILQVYTISFFASLIPYGSAIMLITFLVAFFTDKANLFWSSTVVDNYSFDMTRLATKLLQNSIFIGSLGHYLHSVQKSTTNTISLLISVLFLIYLWFIPKEHFTNFSHLINSQPMSYDYCRLTDKFEHTYRRKNPASKLAMDGAAWCRENWLILREDLRPLQEIIANQN